MINKYSIIDVGNQIFLQKSGFNAWGLVFVRKVLFVTLLCLLDFGYLGVNLFRIDPLAIGLLRSIVVAIILLLFVVDLKSFKINKRVFFVLLIAIIGSATSSLSLNLLFITLIILVRRSLSIHFLASVIVFILGATLIASVLLVQFSIVENVVDVVGSAFEDVSELRSRMTFGYKNVNAFTAIVSAFCLLIMFLWQRTLLSGMVALSIAYTFYVYTDSRTMLLSIASSIVFHLVFSAFVGKKRFLHTLSSLVIFTPVALTLLSPVILNYFPVIDLIASGRFSFNALFFSEIPTYRMLIGGADPSNGVTVDNAFALMVGMAGIPFLLYLAIRVQFLVMQCISAVDHRTYAFILSFWLFSFSESNMIRPESLICLIFWIIVLDARGIKA